MTRVKTDVAGRIRDLLGKPARAQADSRYRFIVSICLRHQIHCIDLLSCDHRGNSKSELRPLPGLRLIFRVPLRLKLEL